jgi:amyloid beta precursor protein binding protein 1
MLRSDVSPSNEKSQKYDRQVRLWGDDGQTAIEGGRVCLINCGSNGTEILKNLILPGIGSFTVIDSNVVCNDDVSSNFFVSREDVGLNRGKVTCKRLLELNPDVDGDHIEESLEQILDHEAGKLLTTFHVVIASDVCREDSIIKLSQVLYEAQIPLFLVKSNGPFALIRLQVKEHTIIQSKPDSVLEDLRLDSPFDSLKEYFNSFDLDSMDKKQVSHVPFVVILYKMLQIWRKHNDKNDKEVPRTYKEKEELRSLIRGKEKEIQSKFSEEESRDLDLVNFEEAVKGVNSVLNSSTFIPRSTEELMTDLNDKEEKNSSFWKMLEALKVFVETKGCLPLRGSIPDMTSDSASFVRLQRIYADQRDQDVREFTRILTSLSQSSSPSESEVKLFCRNTHCLKVIRTPRIADEYTQYSDDDQNIKSPVVKKFKKMILEEEMSNDIESFFGHFICFKALDRFYTRFNRKPGVFEGDLDEDIVQLKSCLKEVLSSMGVSSSSSGSRDDLISSFVSFGGSQVHAVSSFVGGVVAQEVIKVLTKQFVPMDHTLIYDAITSSVQTLSL